MRRFLLGMCLVALFAGVVSGSVAAKERPGGIIASPSKVDFGALPNDGFQLGWVSITNGTAHTLLFREPEVTSPFSFVEARNCEEVAPGQSECHIGYTIDTTAAGTFKTTVLQPFVWLDAKGAEHPMYVAVKLSATVSANHAPTTSSQSVSTPENTSVTITLTGSDLDGDALDFAVWMKNVYDGELSNVDSTGHFTNVDCTTGPPSECTAQTTYTPNEDFTGTDSFGFKVDDGQFFMARGINITVTGVTSATVIADPAALAFGEVTVGDFGQLGVEFTNTSASTLYMKSVTMPAPFTASNVSWTVCEAGIAQDDYCVGYVTFTPLSAETFTGSLTTTWTASDEVGAPVVATTVVPLSGTGS